MLTHEKILNKELIKRTLANLGAVPGNNFGKLGITTDEFIYDKPLVVEEGKFPVFAAEIQNEFNYKVLLSKLPTADGPEFILLFSAGEETIIGIQLIWDEQDCGGFSIYKNKEWQNISMLHKLNFTAGIELIAQEGTIWIPCGKAENLYELFLSLVEN